MTALDTGLLAPVWAGTRVAAQTSDDAFIRSMVDTELALARAQHRVGLVPAAALDVIASVLPATTIDGPALARAARAAANPVVALVARLTEAVASRDPDAANYVHRGSTSQDILDTAMMLVSRTVLNGLNADLVRVAAALAALARAHRDTATAGRTLTQHAVPTTFGLKAAGWLHGVLAASDRVAAVASTLPVSLGGAGGTMAGYVEYARLTGDAAGDPVGDCIGDWIGDCSGECAGDIARIRPAATADRLVAAFAAETGLAAQTLPWHTSRLPLLDLAAALAAVTGALGKIAVDVLFLVRTEVGEVLEPAAAGRGVSSAMPQKCNPVLATLVLAAAEQAPGLLSTVAGCLLAADERPAGAWHAEWQPLRELLRLAGGAAETAAELVEGLRVRPDRMRANLALTDGFIVAERLAVALAPRLGKAAAKTAVGAATAAAGRTGAPLADTLADAAIALAGDGAGPVLTREEIATMLDPLAYLGVAGHLVDGALANYHARPAHPHHLPAERSIPSEPSLAQPAVAEPSLADSKRIP